MTHLTPNPVVGYYSTPNISVPYNDREPGELAPIAIKQLHRYVTVSMSWPIRNLRRDNRDQHVCQICDENIWFTFDGNGNRYKYEFDDIQTLIVAHIRQCHADRVSENGELLDESTGESEVLDEPSSDDTASIHSGNAD